MFAIWKISENKELKLALNTGEVVRLEKRFGGNLVNALIRAGEGELPSLDWMLSIIHGALQKFESGYTLEETFELYDEYVSNGGSQVEMMKLVTEVFKVSGFFPKQKLRKKT